ncbi:MAG: hypothetical protein EOS26_04645 [Mesorhizobium sp.]|nr:MAG: hypothetical protein EOS26_04645 [Mesorhizobium sp.]
MKCNCGVFKSWRMTPQIGIDFRKGSCAKSKCYSVLCAAKNARRCRRRLAGVVNLKPISADRLSTDRTTTD